MAFISPVIRSEFNLYYDRKRPQYRRTSRPSVHQVSPNPSISNGSSSLDSLLERHQRLLQARERTQQRRRNCRSNTLLNVRKISVITETDEENEDTVESINKKISSVQTPKLKSIGECSEEENHPPAEPDASSNTEEKTPEKKKKSFVEKINHWVRSHSIRKRNKSNEMQ
ncbi:unnamed protein product [Caenorhabditis bovis]|uniref:Uncharacterized protein n=1 Tax=Caenorhabditis bovis TaxID=2654633 RepID=A0A8S1EDR5_9PELO|nr:unnamed protein product [Caenorhabditis bovis]